jgi:uncharacterized phosphosugar-binding protein
VSFVPTQSPLPAAPYLDELSAALGRARLANRDSLAAAARIVERVIADDGIVYAFGSGHSQLAALELNRRAGSIASLQVVFDPTWGAAENVEGFGETLVADSPPGAGDCLIAISHSGTTAAAIEVARRARALGVPVIVITSLARVGCAEAVHSSGLKLHQLADVVLDDGTADEAPALPARSTPDVSTAGADGTRRAGATTVDTAPDACAAQTSTIVAAALLHEMVADAVARLAARGVQAPVLKPNSAAGGREHNQRLRDRYRGRVRVVF